MLTDFHHVSLSQPGGRPDISAFGMKAAEKVIAFHQSFPAYAPTPLVSLSALAGILGVRGIHVKDESRRFGLNAFKALGGSYAIGCLIAEELGPGSDAPDYETLVGEDVRRRLGPVTFITATDGNHGRGVAWTAKELSQKAVVCLPRGTAPERLANIRALGAQAWITDLNYDDTVRLACRLAQENGWLLVQDTAFEGYESVPRHIMEGYLTMALEAVRQLGTVRPTHIFLQAGVGSMAGALTAFFADFYGEALPRIVIVEPNAADCIFRTAAADDGKLHFVGGEMHSMMAGLCCGEPCLPAWKILRGYASDFLSVPDSAAALGMRLLAEGVGGGTKIVSGESGAAGFGAAAAILREEGLTELRDRLGLASDSVLLFFSTEGDTDRENYLRVVRDGLLPTL